VAIRLGQNAQLATVNQIGDIRRLLTVRLDKNEGFAPVQFSRGERFN